MAHEQGEEAPEVLDEERAERFAPGAEDRHERQEVGVVDDAVECGVVASVGPATPHDRPFETAGADGHFGLPLGSVPGL